MNRVDLDTLKQSNNYIEVRDSLHSIPVPQHVIDISIRDHCNSHCHRLGPLSL